MSKPDSESPREPSLIVVNQTVNPAFTGWLEAMARELGPVALVSGNAPAGLDGSVISSRGPAYDRSSMRSRLWTWVGFSVVAAWRLLRCGRQIPVFVVTNPPLMPLVAWLLSRLQDRRFGLLEWDIYPQILEVAGVVGPHHVLVRLWRAWHARALRSADLVVTIGEQMAGTLREMAGDPGMEVAVIPNWVDTDRIQPVSREDNGFVQAEALHHGLVVIYSGNLGATHSIETIVQVAEALRDVEGILFLVVGEGAKRFAVEEAIASGRVPNLRLLPRQPGSLFPQVLASAGIGIVTFADGLEGLSMPSKTYDLMAAGVAILGISTEPNDLAATIERHGCGANFAPGAVSAIAAWIKAMADDAAGLERLRRASRQAAVQHYGADMVPIQLTEVVHSRLLP